MPDEILGPILAMLLLVGCAYAITKAWARIASVPISDAAKAFWILFVLLAPILAVPLCFM